MKDVRCCKFLTQEPQDLTALTPEQRLWFAVVYYAVFEYQHYFELTNWRSRYLWYWDAKDAYVWIHSNSRDVFGFIWCCEQVFDEPYFYVKYIRRNCIKVIPDLPLKRGRHQARKAYANRERIE